MTNTPKTDAIRLRAIAILEKGVSPENDDLCKAGIVQLIKDLLDCSTQLERDLGLALTTGLQAGPQCKGESKP